MKNKTDVTVTKQVTTVIRSGKTDYVVSKAESGASLTVNDTNIVIPVGAAGEEIVVAIAEILTVGTEAKPKQKRTRRTKAQIEAAKASV